MSPAAATRPRPPRLIPLTPIEPPIHYRPVRKAVHALCVLVFVALPFSNAVRFDIPRQRFYFAGQALRISEFGIIFFALLFLMFLVAGASMLYGRIYCGYLCPQMIFSEASAALQRWFHQRAERVLPWLKGPARRRLAHACFLLTLGVASVCLAFVVVSYFVEPRDLLRRLGRFDITTAGGVAGAAVTLFTFLDLALVRQVFCTTVCPYGYLQGMLADDQSLLIKYRDDARICIECGKCVRVCEMGIDIRDSPHQIECIHCGDCIDACADVLGRLGRPGLIHYAWGTQGEVFGQQGRSWLQRIGVRDAKRAVLVLVLLFYASGLAVALSMRHPMLVKISPDRTKLYWLAGREVRNHYRMTLENRMHENGFVTLSIDGLNGAHLVLPQNPVPVAGGLEWSGVFEIAAPLGTLPPGVSPFRIVARAEPGGVVDVFTMTFIAPESKGLQ